MASVVASIGFLVVTGWWRKAGRRRVLGVDVPVPRPITLLSGLCTSGIIATTTLAYTFTGVSIVFVMLLMRGGVLAIAPVVDRISGRHVRWFSWVALLLSIASLLTATLNGGGTAITLWCAIDVVCYVGFYFVRLNLMSRLAKSDVPDANLRYFVEEQLVSSPVLLLILAVAAAAGEPNLRAGFVDFWSRPDWAYGIIIGLFSQGAGLFGGLIFLDRRENTFCVPVNRASSVLAGLVGSYGLVHFFAAAKEPPGSELAGAGLIILAIAALSIPPIVERRRARAA
jgi:hypothetical protein